jgi:hypothetical protein
MGRTKVSLLVFFFVAFMAYCNAQDYGTEE